MPRRNNRDRYIGPPLDLTADQVTHPKPLGHRLRPGEQPDFRNLPPGKSRVDREREAAARQRVARIKNGIDWGVCLVPGCGDELKFFGRSHFEDPLDRDPDRTLPLCLRHQLTVWRQVQLERGDPAVIAASHEVDEAARKREEDREAAREERLRARRGGHIYFVRLNGLVKVGWSSDVHTRLRAYGPLADVLCIYPGSRDDETNLHRQLRPVLKRGREWYEDCQIIADYVQQAVDKHGPPKVYDGWTKPKQIIRTRRRAG